MARAWAHMQMPGCTGKASRACGATAGASLAKTRSCCLTCKHCPWMPTRSRLTGSWLRCTGRSGARQKCYSVLMRCSRPWPDPESQALKSPITTSGRGWPGRPIIRRVPTGFRRHVGFRCCAPANQLHCEPLVAQCCDSRPFAPFCRDSCKYFLCVPSCGAFVANCSLRLSNVTRHGYRHAEARQAWCGGVLPRAPCGSCMAFEWPLSLLRMMEDRRSSWAL
ncbi:hypothetical protein ALQ93_01496 [Pseudomonas syringae pv. pisi]|uniref:Uncharacterized protein n=1 Tax=Pseudomonas syringae pv. aptata TaxID=83167 RepID=A0A3M5WYP3_PSEAP|nr:hypothetical protein ALQ93_01496 [Pseudomonas syringae pv. pisi]RML67383.1 hypothetical protein ALQ92_03057 [Pseudomonas syringae pv. pisi]RMM21998.1 hypothetical protein ALQ82_02724 [Pseudomonas syringae pv. pisi]RMU75741.1 hypothetical protein ALP24_04376 [Pseudomonas syringae pv. aptata]